MTTMLPACCVFLVFLFPRSAAAARIDPKHATNITVYHVNGKSYPSVPLNMNTGSAKGDMYFALRSRGLPLECGIWANESLWSRFDCTNKEVVASDLTVTKIVLEVDDRFGDYATCGIDEDTGEYSCECLDAQANCSAYAGNEKQCNKTNSCLWDDIDGRCEIFGCVNITNREMCTQGYRKCLWDAESSKCAPPPGPPVICNQSKVGRLDLSKANLGQHPNPHEHLSTIDFWHANTLLKMYGFWYSTWSDGQCRPNDPSQTFCGWRVAEEVKRVSKKCSDDAMNDAVVSGDASAPWGGRCFHQCSPGDMKNTSSECWIKCFYNNVLGPKGSTQIVNYTSPGSDSGMPLAELVNAWEKPFVDVKDGGCPAV